MLSTCILPFKMPKYIDSKCFATLCIKIKFLFKTIEYSSIWLNVAKQRQIASYIIFGRDNVLTPQSTLKSAFNPNNIYIYIQMYNSLHMHFPFTESVYDNLPKFTRIHSCSIKSHEGLYEIIKKREHFLFLLLYIKLGSP